MGEDEGSHLHLRFSFAERIEDGLYCARALDYSCRCLEDPGKA